MELKFNLPLQKETTSSGKVTPDEVVAVNSKYTVHQAAHFYQVTTAMVLDQKEHPVRVKDQPVMLAFSKLMISLMANGGDYFYGVVGKTYTKGSYLMVNPTGQTEQPALTSAFKGRLLKWMAEILKLNNPSIEEVLDEYFAVFPLTGVHHKQNQSIKSKKKSYDQ
jgi:hypothetical protein